MENLERLTLAEMEDFVRSDRGVQIGTAAGSNYQLVERILRAQGYRRLKRSAKGTVRRFLAK